MKTIPLTRELFAVVDDEDFEVVSWHKWYALFSGHRFYAARTDSEMGTILMHRQIMKAPIGVYVDHICPGDTLDNRRSNLRLATPSQNQFNKGFGRNNKSGAKGVCWDSRRKKWRAEIRHHGLRTHLGYFSTIPDACVAYSKAAERYHGDYARAK